MAKNYPVSGLSNNEHTRKHNKYKGLLKRKFTKKLQERIFHYLDYIYTMAPSFTFLISLMRFVYIIQMFINSLHVSDNNIWNEDALISKVLNVVSVVAFISPKSASETTFIIISYIVFGITTAIILLFFVGLHFFTKYSKLNSYFINLLVIFFNVLLPWLEQVFAAFFGKYFALTISDFRGIYLSGIIISLVFSRVLVFFQCKFVTPSLTFRPQLVNIYFSSDMNLFLTSRSISTSFMMFGSVYNDLVGTIIAYASIIPTLVTLYLSFESHIWISTSLMISVRSITLVTSILIVVQSTLELTDEYSNEIVLFISIFLFFLLRYIFMYLNTKRLSKVLNRLDDLTYNTSNINNYKLKNLLGDISDGFVMGHKICHNWYIFSLAFEKFKNNKKLAVLYAKFSAIYPKETTTLIYALQRLYSVKSGNIDIKNMLAQVNSLLQQRNRTSSSNIKKQLHKIQEKTAKCRSQLRYIWECVIRGTVSELEPLCQQLKDNQDEAIRDYNQLCLVYPNNPYIAYSYYKFLNDIVRNNSEAQMYKQISNKLRNGSHNRVERCYYFAISQFFALPNDHIHTCITNDKDFNNNTLSIFQQDSRFMSFAFTTTINIDNSSEDVYQLTQQVTQVSYVETMIESVKLPTENIAKLVILLISTVIVFSNLIPITLYFYYKSKFNIDAMQLFVIVQRLKNNIPRLILFAFQFILSSNGYSFTLLERYNDAASGSSNATVPDMFVSDRNSLQIYINDAQTIFEDLNSLLSRMNTDSGALLQTFSYIFSDSLVLNTYNSTSSYCTPQSMSFNHFLTLCLDTAIYCLNNPTDALSYDNFYSCIRNVPSVYAFIDNLTSRITDDMRNIFQDDFSLNTLLIIIFSIECVGLVTLTVFLIGKLVQERYVIFSSFKSLPKSTISSIVQQLDTSDGDSTEDMESRKAVIEMNQQEANALRVFSTVNSFKGNCTKFIVFIGIPLFIAISLTCLVFVIDIVYFRRLANNMEDICVTLPQYMVIEELVLSSTVDLLRISLRNQWNYTHPDDYEQASNVAKQCINDILTSISTLKYGSEDSEDIVTKPLSEAFLNSGSTCNNNINYNSIVELTNCLSYESSSIQVYNYLNNIYNAHLIESRSNVYDIINPNLTGLSVSFLWLSEISNTKFTSPCIEATSKEIASYSSSITKNVIVPLIMTLLYDLIFGIYSFYSIGILTETSKWSLRLLLHCNPSVILNSNVFVKLLSNDFSIDESNESDNIEKSSMYESLSSHLLDAVMFLTNDLVVVSCNSSVETVIGQKPDQLIEKHLEDLFVAPSGKEMNLQMFYYKVKSAMGCHSPPNISSEITILRNEEEVPVEISLMAVSSEGQVQNTPTNTENIALIIIIVKDISTIIASQTLLQEERDKGEKLLKMILPPVIVKMIQKGEKNISFSVPSASILFIDIVSFTPWCSSFPAQVIMSTLNKMFAVFDHILSKYPRMVKIKCIGDCYMAAGGIFDEVDEPAEHAKQAISFCVDIIEALQMFNIENNQKLRVRAGINLGGPIVAGILGIEKPTFDILGPAISMAAAMEHNGVPMHVHIPQHMYDLVYDEPFRFKERGFVEIKGKSIKTYIIDGYRS